MKKPLRRTACALLVALIATPSVVAAAQPPEVWITLGQKDAARLRESLARRGEAEEVLQVEADGEIVVARVREDHIPLLARLVHEELRRCGGFVAHPSRDAAFQAVVRELALAPPEALVEYTIDNGPVVQALMSGVQEANVRSTITLAGRVLHALPLDADGPGFRQLDPQPVGGLRAGPAGRDACSCSRIPPPPRPSPP